MKPRKMSLSDRLDEFLDKNCLAPGDVPTRRDPTRPKMPGINAIKCNDCGQAEYLTRTHCRCGHYLLGQLEDEFLEWVEDLQRAHEEMAKTTEKKLKALRRAALVSMPFVVAPMLHFVLTESTITIYAMISIAIGMMILGVMAVSEAHICRPLRANSTFLETCTWESFLEFRSWPRNEGKNCELR
ncbi:hypothetical protein PL335_01285 [Sulfitobacter faviae]|uniref:hypothetical protein n=1 Tax=Sulfitobacter faviae TaxID=1775881 RepID=UPI002307AA83|nr:hypothetical protein [Sulfitobacter faviae]WCE67019.1 hypothetical protein PL335_01285 [Sulfitobacter faviae]